VVIGHSEFQFCILLIVIVLAFHVAGFLDSNPKAGTKAGQENFSHDY